MSHFGPGTFLLTEQIGGWSAYAQLTVSVVLRSPGQPMVTLDDSVTVDDPDCHLAAINFGAVYALSCAKDPERLAVIVHRLHTNPVDTTPMALAFATCHAVFVCLEVSPTKGPHFDKAKKSFVFPARSSF